MLIQVHNHFDFYSIKEGEEAKHIAYAENLVTDKFYNTINSNMQKYNNNSNGAYNMRWMAFGTGTADPSASTGALGALLGIKDSTFISCDYDSVNRRYILVRQITLSPTEYVGSVITEVGVMGYPNSGYGNLLITHALIKDANGNSIGIQKTGDMSILIKATVYINDPVYTDSEDCPGSFYYNSKYRKVPYGTYGSVWHTFVDCLTTLMNTSVAIQTFGTYNFMYTHRGYRFRGYPEFSKSYTGLGGLGSPITINIDTANGAELCHAISLGFNGNYYYSDRLETGAYQHYNFKNTVVSNAVLGTGDGVTTKFKMPHINATNITNTLGTTFNITKGTKKKYRLITDPGIVSQNNYNNDWKFSSNFRKAGMYYIPYKDGYFIFDGIFSVKPSSGATTSVALQGLFMHHISAFTDPFLEPCEIELPSDLYTMMYNAGSPQYFKFFPTDDSSFIVLQYTDSNYANYGTYIMPFDKINGTVSSPVFKANGKYVFKRDMSKCLKVTTGKLYFYDIVASGTSWQLINETAVNIPVSMGSIYNLSAFVATGYTSEFVDDIVQLIYTDRYQDKAQMQRFIIDWDAKSLTNINGSTSAMYTLNVTKNYKAIAGSSNVLNIYDNTGTTLKATFDLSSRVTGTSYAITDYVLFEKDTDLLVLAMYMPSDDPNRNKYILSMAWLKIDTDGTIYDMNVPSNGYATDYYYGQGQPWYAVMKDFIYDNRTFKTLGFGCAYFKDTQTHSTSGSLSQGGIPATMFCMIEEDVRDNYIVFDSAPASGASVIVSYNLDYLPKTADWIATVTPGISFSH